MAENEAKIDEQKDIREAVKPLTGDQAYQYAELLKPSLQDGVAKVKETSKKAKGDMIGALKWFNSMSSAKQKSLVDMATGAATMTKDAVAALTETTVNRYHKITTLVNEQGLTKAAQTTAMDALGKAQELYTTSVNSASSMASDAKSKAMIMANLKREEVLASETVTAAVAWAEATKKAVEESVAVAKAKETGGETLRLANESYAKAFKYAEEKRLEAVQLSTVYLVAAQEQMVALGETEQGKKLQETTKNLLDMTRRKTEEVKEQAIVKNATEQLEASYKLASQSVKAAQDWVAAVIGYQKDGKSAKDQTVAMQSELVEILKSGAEGVD